MIPTNVRELTMITFACAVMTLTIIIGGQFLIEFPDDVILAFVGSGCGLFGLCLGLLVLNRSKKRVDPWEYQQRLMLMSGQQLPETLQLNKTSLLYLALIIEEFGETCSAVTSALVASGFVNRSELVRITALLQAWFEEGKAGSMALRNMVAKLPNDYVLPLTQTQATQIGDGTTDLAVVNSGFALACGLPGAELYEAVAESNLSKANPITGLIEKDASGKWIKGSQYQSPQIDAVLATRVRLG